MKALNLNRIIVVLTFLGLFIAGTLSLAKFWHVMVPCGGASGCEVVTNDKSSIWFGVPVAYIGLLGYLAIGALAVLRAVGPAAMYKKTILPAYIFSAGGALISIGLQFYSFFVIRDVCKWCLASAATMTGVLIVHALLYQEVSEGNVPGMEVDKSAPATTDQPSGEAVAKHKSDFLVVTGAGAVLVCALLFSGYQLQHADPAGVAVAISNDITMMPASPNRFGDPTSPIIIYEFADLNCPSCQNNSPLVKEFVREHEHSIQLIYRHLPLPMHKTSAIAAAIDEYAAEKGKFWDYTMAVMSTHKEVDDPQELFAIATQIGMDENDIRKRLANDSDPIYKRLQEDENAANAIGIKQTPTFIVFAPGIGYKLFGGSKLKEALVEAPYDKWTKAKV